MEKPTALVYTRKSRITRADTSDPANSQVRQAEMCAAFCQARGWAAEVFSEPEGSRSGATEDKRPGFLALKTRLLREPKPVAVVVWRLDRLSRNKRDIFAFLDDLQKRGIDFVTATGNIDTTTAFGRAFLGFQAVMSELEREITGERRVEEAAYKQAHGYHVGTAPLGYDHAGGVLTPNDKSETARYILTCYLTGQYSYCALSRHVNAQGYRNAKGQPFCREAIREVLENCWVYAGFVERYTDYMARAHQTPERYKGKHQGLITEDAARSIEIIRQQRRSLNWGLRPQAYVYLLSPLLYCARCGGRLEGWHNRGRRHYWHNLWERNCPGPCYVPADPLETALIEHLQAHAIPLDLAEEINGHLAELSKQNGKADSAQAIAALEKRRERAKRLYLLGEMDDAELEAELQAVKQELTRYLPAAPPPVVPLTVEAIKSIGQILEVASREEQKALIYNLFERLETDGRELVKAVPRAWASSVFGPGLAIG